MSLVLKTQVSLLFNKRMGTGKSQDLSGRVRALNEASFKKMERDGGCLPDPVLIYL